MQAPTHTHTYMHSHTHNTRVRTYTFLLRTACYGILSNPHLLMRQITPNSLIMLGLQALSSGWVDYMTTGRATNNYSRTSADFVCYTCNAQSLAVGLHDHSREPWPCLDTHTQSGTHTNRHVHAIHTTKHHAQTHKLHINNHTIQHT